MLRALLEDVTVCVIKRKVPDLDDVWLPGNRKGIAPTIYKEM